MFKLRKNTKSIKPISELRKNKSSILGYTPVDYSYTPEFKQVCDNREAWAKNEIKNIKINEYSSSLLDPKIDSQVILEIANAKLERVKHNSVIKELSDLLESEAYKARQKIQHLEQDVAKYKEQLMKLESLQKALNTKNWGGKS